MPASHIYGARPNWYELRSKIDITLTNDIIIKALNVCGAVKIYSYMIKWQADAVGSFYKRACKDPESLCYSDGSSSSYNLCWVAVVTLM